MNNHELAKGLHIPVAPERGDSQTNSGQSPLSFSLEVEMVITASHMNPNQSCCLSIFLTYFRKYSEKYRIPVMINTAVFLGEKLAAVFWCKKLQKFQLYHRYNIDLSKEN